MLQVLSWMLEFCMIFWGVIACLLIFGLTIGVIGFAIDQVWVAARKIRCKGG